jgi:hypothetical protein
VCDDYHQGCNGYYVYVGHRSLPVSQPNRHRRRRVFVAGSWRLLAAARPTRCVCFMFSPPPLCLCCLFRQLPLLQSVCFLFLPPTPCGCCLFSPLQQQQQQQCFCFIVMVLSPPLQCVCCLFSTPPPPMRSISFKFLPPPVPAAVCSLQISTLASLPNLDSATLQPLRSVCATVARELQHWMCRYCGQLDSNLEFRLNHSSTGILASLAHAVTCLLCSHMSATARKRTCDSSSKLTNRK